MNYLVFYLTVKPQETTSEKATTTVTTAETTPGENSVTSGIDRKVIVSHKKLDFIVKKIL